MSFIQNFLTVMTKIFVPNGVKKSTVTKNIMILSILLISFSGCSHCKSGQVKLNGACFYPGETYTTTLTGDIIR